MFALKITIETLSPLLATQPQAEEPNSAVSYSFVPGSMIRGALISYYNGRKDATDPDFRRLFLDGKVRFLNAYPASFDNQQRGLPKPLSWLLPKDRADDLDEPVLDIAITEQTSDQPLKPPKGEFFWKTDESIWLRSTNRHITVHNASDERNYKSKNVSQVFRYEAIASEEMLVGYFIAEDGKDLELLQKKISLPDALSMGGSMTAGYGRIKMTIDNDIQTDWREVIEDEAEYDDDDSRKTTSSQESLCTLTCLSDIVLPPDAADVLEWIRQITGAHPQRSYYRLSVIGGFNRTWGLPLPQARAIQAGSVFVFAESDRNALLPLVDRGIGMRLVEGFGRVAVNLNALSHLVRKQWKNLRFYQDQPEPLSDLSRQLAQRMARRAWESKVERLVAQRIFEHREFSGLPSPAQLNQARLAARQAWLNGDLEAVRKYVEEDVGRSNLRKQQWERARIGSESLLEWLKDRTGSKEFAVPGDSAIAGQMPAWTDQDRQRAVARLIEGVLRRAVLKAKRRRNER